MQARWLKNPATGVVFPATDALLARGDLVPVADEAGAPLVTAADAKAIERELQDLHAENQEMRQRLADQATEIAVLRANLDQAERDLARVKAATVVEAKPAPSPAPAPQPDAAETPAAKPRGARRAATPEPAPVAPPAEAPAPAAGPVDDLAASLANLNI